MTEETSSVKVYTRIRPSLARRLRVAAAHKDLNLPDAFELAISAWVDAANESTTEANPPASPSKDRTSPTPSDRVRIESASGILKLTSGEVPWVIRLINILRSGTVAARGIKWNIMMVMKAMGLWHESEDSLLPEPTEDIERAARRDIEIAERLIAESEKYSTPDKGSRKTRRRA